MKRDQNILFSWAEYIQEVRDVKTTGYKRIFYRGGFTYTIQEDANIIEQ